MNGSPTLLPSTLQALEAAIARALAETNVEVSSHWHTSDPVWHVFLGCAAAEPFERLPFPLATVRERLQAIGAIAFLRIYGYQTRSGQWLWFEQFKLAHRNSPLEVIIRPARPDEAAKIVAIQKQAIEQGSREFYTEAQLRALIESKSHPRRYAEELLVADREGEAIAFAGLTRTANQISAVFVHPNWGDRGVGSQLLDAIEWLALQRYYVSLNVLSSLNARGFYQARGFSVLRKTSVQLPQKIPCLLMRKRLLPPQLPAAISRRRWRAIAIDAGILLAWAAVLLAIAVAISAPLAILLALGVWLKFWPKLLAYF